MSVNGKFEDITRVDLLVEADRFGVQRAKDLLADVRGVLENWTSCANEAKLRMATTGRVSKDFRLL
jgi:serine/threonine-protein kinase HipA